MSARLTGRLKRVERSKLFAQRMVDTFYCTIDGQREIMTALDFCYAVAVEGRRGEMGNVAGRVRMDCESNPNALNEAFEALAQSE